MNPYDEPVPDADPEGQPDPEPDQGDYPPPGPAEGDDTLPKGGPDQTAWAIPVVADADEPPPAERRYGQ